jgi:hypothetical protein
VILFLKDLSEAFQFVGVVALMRSLFGEAKNGVGMSVSTRSISAETLAIIKGIGTDTMPQHRRYLILMTMIPFVSDMVHSFSITPRIHKVPRPSSIRLLDQIQEEETSVSSPSVWDWNYAAGSIGSMLLRMQKEEEELRKTNQSSGNSTFAVLQSQAVEFDPLTMNRTAHSEVITPPPPKQPELRTMNKEAAKELDDAVTILPGSAASLTEGIQIRALPSEYLALKTVFSETSSEKMLEKDTDNKVKQRRRKFPRRAAPPPVASASTDVQKERMPLSLPEHYRDRISRDLRHLAVSIASSVEDVSQWRLFCQEKGGIIPLLECVREGARALQEQEQLQKDSSPAASSSAWATDEESFLVACSACRAIRDICAISPEVAVVITDCILRANTAWLTEGHSLMSDFVTLLQHGEDFDEEERSSRRRWYSLRRKANNDGGEFGLRRPKSVFRLQVRRHKRGEYPAHGHVKPGPLIRLISLWFSGSLVPLFKRRGFGASYTSHNYCWRWWFPVTMRLTRFETLKD